MKIYGNWKLFIITLNAVIVITVLSFVIYSFTIKNDLVEEDYYRKGLNYQQQINKIDRSGRLKENVKLFVNPGKIVVKYPSFEKYSDISGKINFFRASAKEKDFVVPVKVSDNGEQLISTVNRDKGMWIVKIDWSCNNISYYFEEEILVN